MNDQKRDPDDPDGIGAYYRRCEERKLEAWARYDAAKEAGADEATLRKLKDAAHWAGYTGD